MFYFFNSFVFYLFHNQHKSVIFSHTLKNSPRLFNFLVAFVFQIISFLFFFQEAPQIQN